VLAGVGGGRLAGIDPTGEMLAGMVAGPGAHLAGRDLIGSGRLAGLIREDKP
jgi:hypothetical protein